MTTTLHPPRLSAELHLLNTRFGQEPVRLGDVLDVMGQRAYALLLVVLSLPFFTPVTLLGISTAFGILMVLLALLGLVFRLDPRHLPRRVRNWRLPPRFFGLLLRGAERMIRLLERYSRRRHTVFVSSRAAQVFIGGGIIVSALLLSAPLPLPLTNFLPAIAIVLLADGILEDDGAMVLAGFGAVLASLVLFGLIALFGVEIFDFLRDWFSAHFGSATPAPEAAP